MSPVMLMVATLSKKFQNVFFEKDGYYKHDFRRITSSNQIKQKSVNDSNEVRCESE